MTLPAGAYRLINDLKNVDRSKTPWIIAVEHHPWYGIHQQQDSRRTHHVVLETAQLRYPQ